MGTTNLQPFWTLSSQNTKISIGKNSTYDVRIAICNTQSLVELKPIVKILLKANLTSNIPLEMEAFHKHSDSNNKDKELTREPNGESEARMLEYVKDINQTVIQTLYEMYKIDFELFNYNMKGLTR